MPTTAELGARFLDVEASAPGKLVVSGEYAVLAGAPALVAAVDRRVTCNLVPRDRGGWRFVSTGFEEQWTLTRDAVFQAPADSVAGVVRQVIAEDRAPDHIEVRIDSTPCLLNGVPASVPIAIRPPASWNMRTDCRCRSVSRAAFSTA